MAQASHNGRPVERLQILLQDATGLMGRLRNVEIILNDEGRKKAMPWVDKRNKKVVACLQKKFPEYPSLSEVDKSQGPEDLQLNAQALCEQLEDMYLALQDSLEFGEEAWKLLTELADDYVCPPLEDATEFYAGYLDLFVAYVHVVLATSQVPDKDMVACFYAYCYQYALGSADVTFTKLAHYLDSTCKDRPTAMAALRAQFKEEPKGNSLRKVAVSDFISRLMMGVEGPNPKQGVLEGFMRCSSLDVVTGDEVMGVLGRVEAVQFPTGLSGPAARGLHQMLPYATSMSSWMCHAVVICPEMIYKHEDGVGLLRMAAAAGWCVQYSHCQINPHTELYDIFHDKAFIAAFEEIRTKKGYKDGKAAFKETVAHCVAFWQAELKQRMGKLETSLRQMCNTFADCPGLLGPHWQLVRISLIAARGEMLRFLNHKQGPSVKGEKVYKGLTFDKIGGLEEGFACLFGAASALVELASKYWSVSADYHKAYLRDVHAVLVAQSVEACKPVLQSILKEPAALAVLDSFSGRAQSAEGEHMEGLVLDYQRFLFAMLRSMQYASLESQVKELIHRMQRVCVSAECVGQPVGALMDAFSMHDALFRLTELWDTMNMLLTSSPALAGRLVPIFDSFSATCKYGSEEEMAIVGKEAARLAGRCVNQVALGACSLVREILVESTKLSTIPGPAVNGWDPVTCDTPGGLWRMMEAQDGKFAKHSRAYDGLVQLCIFFSIGKPTLRIYSEEIHPAGLLVGNLRSDMSQFVREALWVKGQQRQRPQPPSTTQGMIAAYRMALTPVEEYAGVEVSEVSDHVMSKLFVDPICGELGTRLSLTGDDSSACETHSLAQWYAGQLMAPGTYFSATQKAFVSKAGELERFTSLKELRALCTMLGPAGVRTFERTLVKHAMSLAGKIHSIINANARVFQAAAQENAKCTDATALQKMAGQMSQLEEFTTAAIGLGSLMTFRKHLHFALDMVMSHTGVPEALALAVATSIAEEGGRLHGGSAETAGLDVMAYDCGQGYSALPVDAALREALTADLTGPLSASAVRKGDWAHAHLAFSAVVYSQLLNTEHLSRQEALRSNAHCLPAAIVALVSLTVRDKDASPEATGVALARSLDLLVGACTRSVLALSSGKGGKLSKDSRRRQALVLFLEALVREAEAVDKSARQCSLPYALTRAEHLEPLKPGKEGAVYDYGEEEED